MTCFVFRHASKGAGLGIRDRDSSRGSCIAGNILGAVARFHDRCARRGLDSNRTLIYGRTRTSARAPESDPVPYKMHGRRRIHESVITSTDRDLHRIWTCTDAADIIQHCTGARSRWHWYASRTSRQVSSETRRPPMSSAAQRSGLGQAASRTRISQWHKGSLCSRDSAVHVCLDRFGGSQDRFPSRVRPRSFAGTRHAVGPCVRCFRRRTTGHDRVWAASFRAQRFRSGWLTVGTIWVRTRQTGREHKEGDCHGKTG